MKDAKERWDSCLTFKQEHCPNQELTKKAFVLQQGESIEDLDKDSQVTYKKAQSFCEICSDYSEDFFGN